MAEQPPTGDDRTDDRTVRFDLGSPRLRPLPWRTVAAAVGGLILLGIAAAAASRGLPERASEGGAAPVDAVDPRIGDFFAWVLIVLAAGIVLFTLWPSERRPRRRGRRPISLRQLLIGMALVVVLMFVLRPLLPEQTAESEDDVVEVTDEAENNGARPGWTLVLLAGALGAAIGGVAVLGRRMNADAPAETIRLDRALDTPTSVIAESGTTSAPWTNVIDVTDPQRAAVVRDYAMMLGDLATSGYGRRASEAPEEYVRRLVAETSASESARRLTRLFEIAGFSDQQTTEAMVAEAGNALDAVRRDLGNTGR